MILIGISGKKGSGKDTISTIIKEHYKHPVYITGFADELKKEVSKATGCSVEFIEQHKDEFRTILQWWGTDFRRHFVSDNYWIVKMVKYLNLLPNSQETIVIIKDVRFIDEYNFIRESGGILIRIEREDVKKDTHSSETDLDSATFKYVVQNNGTLSELKERTKQLMKETELI